MKTRLNYARLLVEVFAADELPDEISLNLYNGEIITQKVEYEWVPPKCSICKCCGHIREQCNPKQMWIPKNNDKDRVDAQENRSEGIQELIISKDTKNQSRNQEGNDRINQEDIIFDQENNTKELPDQNDQTTAMEVHQLKIMKKNRTIWF